MGGEEGVLGQGELFEFGCGVEEFAVCMWGQGEVAAGSVGGFGVGIAGRWEMGFAVDAQGCVLETLFENLVELEFLEGIEALDGVFGIELVGAGYECIKGGVEDLLQ